MSQLSLTTSLTCELINKKSITPDDAGCQKILGDLLRQAGFKVEDFSSDGVQNFYATHGTGSPVLCFAGHTDVVAEGDVTAWQYPPFNAQIVGDTLYGRGAADMKGSLAAIHIATLDFVKVHTNHNGTIAILVTSDEEGDATFGTRFVVEKLRTQGRNIDYCIVGEPSSTKYLGDVVKNGRRGSLSGDLTIYGKQGHVAYPHLALNPLHLAAPFLTEISQIKWDIGDDFFPPTSLQMVGMQTSSNISNVIPASVTITFNFRFGAVQTPEKLKQTFTNTCQKHNLNYQINWHLSGLPFFTAPGKLLDSVKKSIKEVVAITPELSTSGGTSDGRFIATLPGCEVVELGPINQTIHQVNECVSISDLNKLTNIYQQIMLNILGNI